MQVQNHYMDKEISFLNDVKNRKLSVETRIDLLDEEDTFLKNDLCRFVNNLDQQKSTLTDLQKVSDLLETVEALPMEEWTFIAGKDKEESKRIKHIEEESEELKGLLNDLADKTEADFTILKEKILELDERCQRTSEKKRKLESLKEKLSRNQNLKQKQELQKTALSSAQTECNDFRTEIQVLQASQVKVDNIISEHSKLPDTSITDTIQTKTKWCTDVLSYLGDIGELNEHSTVDTVTIVISQSSENPVLLALKYAINRFGKYLLQSAETNITELDIADLAEAAVRLNDTTYLIQGVKSRWGQQSALLNDIRDLRQRYAIDWLSDDRLIKVILGNGAQTVVTLHIGPTYPANNAVTLNKIEGSLPTAMTIEGLKPEIENTRILDWIQYLDVQLKL